MQNGIPTDAELIMRIRAMRRDGIECQPRQFVSVSEADISLVLQLEAQHRLAAAIEAVAKAIYQTGPI